MGEEMSKMLNNYFLSIFIQENLATILDGVQVLYQGKDNDKLRDVIITWQVVPDEIAKVKKTNCWALTNYFQEFSKNTRRSSVALLQYLQDVVKFWVCDQTMESSQSDTNGQKGGQVSYLKLLSSQLNISCRQGAGVEW